MAIVRHCGMTTLFITISANLNWKVVQEELQHKGWSLRAFDRPNVVNQVFQLKVQALLINLKKHNIFGPYWALGISRSIRCVACLMFTCFCS
jgi:hypothetical protein